MTGTTKRALVPHYFHRFVCIGGECEDTCCGGWQVPVDRAAYLRYAALDDAELLPIFAESLRESPERTEHDYARIHTGSDRKCPMMSGEGLCRIQLKYGEPYLCDVCAVYPRHANEVGGVREQSLSASCPEAARLILFQPDGLEFDEVLLDAGARALVTGRIDPESRLAAGTPEAAFWALRILTIQILQNRSYALDDRLLMLGLFYEKAQELVDGGQGDQLADWAQGFGGMIESEAVRPLLRSFQPKTDVKLTLLNILLQARDGMGIRSARYADALARCRSGLGLREGAALEEVVPAYEHACREYYEPFISEHGYLLENWLVNHVFKTLFPLHTPSLYEDFCLLALHYAWVKLLLVGMSAQGQGLSNEDVLLAVQSYSKEVEHVHAFTEGLYVTLTGLGYTRLPYVALLVKG